MENILDHVQNTFFFVFKTIFDLETCIESSSPEESISDFKADAKSQLFSE